MKNRLIMAISALTLIALATAAFAAPVSLTIERPKMREIYISWLSQDGASADCVITQRLTIFSPWEPMKTFSLASGATLAINMDNFMPIYSEQKVSCTSGDVSILTSSTFKIFGGQSIVQSCPVLSCPVVEPVVCPELPTTTTTLPQPSCRDQGYIYPCECVNMGYMFPSECGGYGWIQPSSCPVDQCNTEHEYCNENSDCCSGLYCHSDHKCEPVPVTTTTTTLACKAVGVDCTSDSQCCTDHCHQDGGHKHCKN